MISSIITRNILKIDVQLQDETFWLNQKQMAELFGVVTLL